MCTNKYIYTHHYIYMVHDIHKFSQRLRCTEIGGVCGSFPSPEARRDEGLNLLGPVVLGYIRPRARGAYGMGKTTGKP